MSLFRFIEFWMGLPYIEIEKVHLTLDQIKEDPRLPGGQIDTEYFKDESSSGGVKSAREVLAEMMVGAPETTSNNADDKLHVNNSVPKWLRNIDKDSQGEIID